MVHISNCVICSSKPLCNACSGCGGMVHILIESLVSCSCSHVSVAKHNKHLKAEIHCIALEP